MGAIEIQPADIQQVQTHADSGEFIAIDDDVQGVARELRDLAKELSAVTASRRERQQGPRGDFTFKLYYSKHGGYFYVTQEWPDGSAERVTTAQELDPRILQRVREVTSENYDLGAELDRLDAESDRESEHEFEERVGEYAERLEHAVKKDMGIKTRAFIGD